MGAGVTSQAVREIEAAVITFMEKRNGADVRVIRELSFGDRRIDLAFVYPADIVGVEIKGPKDSPGSERVGHQMREYNFYLPEVWLAVHTKWAGHKSLADVPNLMILNGDEMLLNVTHPKWEPRRDEMCCSRLIERLWDSEARAIAGRLGLVQCQLVQTMKGHKVRKILARMMTGHESMREVCSELRRRPSHMTGAGSSAPIKRPGFSPPLGVADLFDRR